MQIDKTTQLKMKENDRFTRMAMCELGDYFSRLGGAARPFNMRESEIHLYVGYKLLQLNNISINEEEYANQPFLEAAKPVIEKTNEYLCKINLLKNELFPFVLKFYTFADEKLKADEKTKRWGQFGKYLNKNNNT